LQVHAHQAVVGGVHELRAGLAGRGPVHGGGDHLEGAGGQHVVHAQVPGSGVVTEVGGVKSGIALMGGVRAALLLRRGGTALAARGGVLDPRVGEQLVDRAGPGVAVDGVGVHVAEHHELGVGAQTAGSAVIVRDPGGASAGAEVVRPQPDLVVVAALDRKSTRLNSSHVKTSYAVFCLK